MTEEVPAIVAHLQRCGLRRLPRQAVPHQARELAAAQVLRLQGAVLDTSANPKSGVQETIPWQTSRFLCAPAAFCCRWDDALRFLRVDCNLGGGIHLTQAHKTVALQPLASALRHPLRQSGWPIQGQRLLDAPCTSAVSLLCMRQGGQGRVLTLQMLRNSASRTTQQESRCKVCPHLAAAHTPKAIQLSQDTTPSKPHEVPDVHLERSGSRHKQIELGCLDGDGVGDDVLHYLFGPSL